MSINLTDELLAKTKKGKIASAKQVFLNGDQENLQQIGEKTHQLEDSIKDITVSGGASTATAVSYNNETSGMTAVTAQGAIDELAAKNQEQDATIGTKAEKSEVATELDKKFNKENIAQESGDAEDKVMSQKAVSKKLSDLSNNVIVNPLFDYAYILSNYKITYDDSKTWALSCFLPIDIRIVDLNINGYQNGDVRVNSATFYDENKEPISGITLPTSEYLTNDNYEVPEGAKYVRFCWKLEEKFNSWVKIVINESLKTLHENTSVELSKKFNKSNIAQEFGNAEDKVVSQKVVSKNILNDIPYKFAFILKDGNIIKDASKTWALSDYIPIDIKAILHIRGYVQSASVFTASFYNEKKSLISGIVTEHNTYLTNDNYEVPEGAKYVRFCWQLEEKFNSWVKVNNIENLVGIGNFKNALIRKVKVYEYAFILKDGNITKDASKAWALSEFLKLDEISIQEIYLHGYILSNVTVATISYYNSSKEFIGYESCSQSETLTLKNIEIPNNATYIRFCWATKYNEDTVRYLELNAIDSINEKIDRTANFSEISPLIKNGIKIYTVCNDLNQDSKKARNYSAKLYLDHLYSNIDKYPSLSFENRLNFVPFYSKYEKGYATSYVNSDTNNQKNNILSKKFSLSVIGADSDGSEVAVEHISVLNSITKDKPVRLLCIGDSVTAGSNANANKPYETAPEAYWQWVQAFFEMDKIDASNEGFDCITLGNYISKPNPTDLDSTWVTRKNEKFDLKFDGYSKSDIMACCCALAGSKTSNWLSDKLSSSVDNPFYDKTNKKFSLKYWVENYRTLMVLQDGSTTRCSTSNKGKLVKDNEINEYNVCEPTHVLIAFGYNQMYNSDDSTRSAYLSELRTMIDTIHSEYPNVYIMLQMPDTSGTYFPNLYPNYIGNDADIYPFDYTRGTAKRTHDKLAYMTKDLMGLEDLDNKVIYVPSYFVSPLCDGGGFRNVCEPSFLSLKNDDARMRVMTGTNGPYLHPNNAAHAVWGYQIYSIIKWTIAKDLQE